ncbi:MAG: YgiQ family radical SAM protein [Syntrophales bacterium]|nr:YgiQ family radical SAM protein [Syntrophales bacterium]
MFLPTTGKELMRLGWERCDVILVTGDTYMDSPFIGAAVIGKTLMKAGFRVGIIAQPDTRDGRDIGRMGEPALFWGVTGGSVDSMIANYTASLKKRKADDYTPGGENSRRPDRAVIVYANLIRRHFKNTAPLILGGIEASLRRMVHYDYWSDSLRRSILFDAKADALIYGMGESTVLELARRLKNGENFSDLRGVCLISRERPVEVLEVPGWDEVRDDRESFIRMSRLFHDNNDPFTGMRLIQRHGNRYLIQNPPPMHESVEEMDRYYDVDYERGVHPFYEKDGPVRALETIGFSIPTHRGCYGQCNFCAITLHEGRAVRWRSRESILAEARRLREHPGFKGYITDLSGPTANMYAIECGKKMTRGACLNRRCLFPEPCPLLRIDHSPQIELFSSLRRLRGVKKVFLSSGIRPDVVLRDGRHGMEYLRMLLRYHVSGQMKIAPEHTEEKVLRIMGKPGVKQLPRFREDFYRITEEEGREQHLTYYLMAAHPGCNDDHMIRLHDFAKKKLHIRPEQVQIFIPAPSTWSSVMHYTEKNPFTGEKLFVEKSLTGKNRQKELVAGTGLSVRAPRKRRTGKPLKLK